MAILGRLENFLSGQRISPDAPPPYLLRFRSSKGFIITTICVAVFTDIFLYGVIVPVIPFSLTERANIPPENVQHWVSVLLAIYGAALLAGSPFAGWYADNSSSRRLPLLIGLVALAASTVMLCLANNIALLVCGRLLQGLAAAIVWTVGQALLVDTVGQKDIGQVMGYVSISMSVGIMLAPLLGGVVYEKSGYYAVYYMGFALIALDIFLRLVLIEKKIARQWKDDGTSPSELVTPMEISTLTLSTSHEITEETKKKAAIPSEVSEPASAPTPPPPTRLDTLPHSKFPPVLTLLKSRRLLAALWGCLIQASLMTAFDSVLPLFVQSTFGWDSLGAGLIFLPIMLPGFLAPISGAVSDRYGPRWLAVCGFLLTVPFLVLLRFVTNDSMNQKILLCALLALIGFCLAIVMPPLMAEITYIVEAKEVKSPGIFGANGAYAQAYGLFVMAFAAGCLVGPIWAGFVANSAGWGTAMWSLGILSAAGALPAAIWTGGFIGQDNAKSGEERALGRPGKKSEDGDVEDGVVRETSETP